MLRRPFGKEPGIYLIIENEIEIEIEIELQIENPQQAKWWLSIELNVFHLKIMLNDWNWILRTLCLASYCLYLAGQIFSPHPRHFDV